MSPGCDQYAVATANTGLYHQLPATNGVVVEQCSHQSIHRVAAEVFSYGQNPARLSRGGDDAVASADGQGQWLLALDVQAKVQQLNRHEVMRTGVGGAVGRL